MSNETRLNEIVFNYLTQEQYEEALRNGELEGNEFYMTPKAGDVVPPHSHDSEDIFIKSDDDENVKYTFGVDSVGLYVKEV